MILCDNSRNTVQQEFLENLKLMNRHIRAFECTLEEETSDHE